MLASDGGQLAHTLVVIGRTAAVPSSIGEPGPVSMAVPSTIGGSMMTPTSNGTAPTTWSRPLVGPPDAGPVDASGAPWLVRGSH